MKHYHIRQHTRRRDRKTGELSPSAIVVHTHSLHSAHRAHEHEGHSGFALTMEDARIMRDEYDRKLDAYRASLRRGGKK